MRDVLALIGFQGMVNEIALGILDPLPLNGTYKVETFHPHGCLLFSCRSHGTATSDIRHITSG